MSKVKIGLGILILLLGFAMVCACGLLIYHNEQESLEAADSVRHTLPELKEKIAEVTGDPENTLYQRYLLGDAYVAPDSDEAAEEFVIPMDGYSYIGYLTFPTLGMELPVLDSWDTVRLRKAPCRYYGSAETQDLVIAAHNYRSSFGQLQNLQYGDELMFTDAAGIVHRYLVGEIEIVGPTEIDYMINSDWDLSLYTCTYGGAQRLTVRCSEQESTPAPVSDAV